jgi:hypothetical protein
LIAEASTKPSSTLSWFAIAIREPFKGAFFTPSTLILKKVHKIKRER